MSNINTATRRKQWLTAGSVALALAAGGGAIWGYTQHQAAQKAPQQAATADMTGGLITSSFNDTVAASALAQQQNKTSGLESSVAQLKQESKTQTENMNKKFDELMNKIQQMQSESKSAGSGAPATPPAGPNAPQGSVPTGPSKPAQWNITDPGRGPNGGQPEDRRLGDGRDAPVSSSRIVNMQLTKTPNQFALWQAADNLQNMRFPDLGIPCPFIMSWTVSVEEQVKSQNEAFNKEQDLGKKASTAYAKMFPGTQRAYEEWRELRQGLATNEISMCDFNFNLTLFTPDSNSGQQECEDAAINVFRKNELEISAPRFQQLRNWLSSFPFMMQEGLWEDMVQMGATLRCKSFNAVNLMPVVAERQMSAVGSPLPTYRNALAFFDMFSESNGATNFNIAVTGTTGAGKSFFIQEILRQVLNANGFAWVIDMGASYKNFCQQAGGVYLDGATLRFNPFANVTNINESAEGITGLLTVLASPNDPLDKVSESILLKAVIAAWEAKGNKARIDDVVAYMISEEVTIAYDSQPTIRDRINELVLLLDRWCTHGADGEYFNSDSPTLDGETRFAVLELLSLESRPHLLSAILYSLILAIQEKMYHSPRDLKKVAIIDEAWRLFSGSNPHAARFIETG